MSRFASAAVIGVAVLVLGGTAVAAGPSPIGTWKADTGNMYRLATLPGGGFAQYSLTPHTVPSNKCPIKAGTLVYRYHALGGSLYRLDSFIWRKDCSTYWSNAERTLKFSVTERKLTIYEGSGYTKVWWSFTRPAGDTQAPFVQAIESTGTVGATTSLRYAVHDNSGKTWDELTIYRDGKVARHYRTPLGPSKAGRVYAYKLDQTPASFRGAFRFCVRSHDATGNVSKTSCATVTIR